MAIMSEIRRKLPMLKGQATETDALTLYSPTVVDTNPEAPHVQPGAAVVSIPIDDIIPNRAQPRTAFNQNAIVRLSDSIRRYGILQPLTVRKVLLPPSSPKSSGGCVAVYELVAGERRLRAAKLAELTAVPCIIINTDDATSAELAIIENLLRENLNMFEQAEAFQRLIQEFHLTQDEAARRVSMSQSAVANKLRILRLSPEERQKILQAGLTERHARALLKITDQALRGDVLQHILDRKLNVSATEAYIDNLLTEMARYEYRVSSGRNQMSDAPPKPTPAIVPTTQSRPQTPQTPKLEPILLDEPFAPMVFEPCDATDADIGVIPPRKQANFKGSINDLRPFYNSIQNALNILESIGIVGRIDKQEQENEVKVTITLSKRRE